MEVHEWTLTSGTQAIAWAFSLCYTSLVIASFPELKRWTGFSLLVIPAYAALQTSPNLSPNRLLNSTYSRFVIILFSHMAALCFRPRDEAKTIQYGIKNITSPWKQGWKRAYNARGIGFAWENAYLWPEQRSTRAFATQETLKDKPIEKPKSRHNLASRSKWSAIIIRLMYALLNWILLSLYYEYRISATFGSFTAADLSPEKESILRRFFQQLFSDSTSPVTAREINIRALMTVNKFIADIFYLSALHDLLAVFFIGIGVDESWEWPPLFGSLFQAYTMRRFWAGFWHRLVYKSFNFHAATCTKLLRIPPMSSRIVNNFLVFVLSAIMHAVVLYIYGDARAWGRGTFLFWCIQPLSFVLEAVTQHYWRTFSKGWLSRLDPLVLLVFERAVGYCWVVAWLLWVTPKSVFPFFN